MTRLELVYNTPPKALQGTIQYNNYKKYGNYKLYFLVSLVDIVKFPTLGNMSHERKVILSCIRRKLISLDNDTI